VRLAADFIHSRRSTRFSIATPAYPRFAETDLLQSVGRSDAIRASSHRFRSLFGTQITALPCSFEILYLVFHFPISACSDYVGSLYDNGMELVNGKLAV